MHELAIAESLLVIVQEEIVHHSLENVLRIKVKVGKLTAVQPEALSFCFACITEDTPLKGVALDIEVLGIKGYCEACKGYFEVQDPVMICPKCQSWHVRMEGGRELYIDAIEIA
jgi:hydrogenase nickel incorporation protein HypA/HybF